MKRGNIRGLLFLGTIGLGIGGASLTTHARVSRTLETVNYLIDMGIKSTVQHIMNGNRRINDENLKRARDRAIENATSGSRKVVSRKDLKRK